MSWLERGRIVAISAVLLLSLTGTAVLVAGVGSSSFVDNDIQEQRGDVATITVDTGDTSTVTVVIGSERVGYRAVVTATDGPDSDDDVTIRLNTLQAPNNEEAFEVVGSDTLDEVRVTTEPDFVLGTTDYGLLVYDGPEVREQWSDSGVLDLTPTPEPKLSPLVVPTGDQPTTLDSVADTAVEPGEAVALGESLVLELGGLPAIEGYLGTRPETTGQLLETLTDDSGPYRLRIVEADPEINTDPTRLHEQLSSENTEVYRDDERVLLVVDTAELSGNGLATEYEATLDVGPFETDDEYANLDPIQTEFQLAQPQVSITRQNGFAVDRASLTGTTTLTPGTTLTVRVKTPAGVVPRKNAERVVTVGPDQRWSAEFDFSAYDEGDEYRLTVTDDALVNRTVTGTVRVDDPPRPAFSVSPSTPSPDERITFNAAPSSDDGQIERYEWDLDGDGRFDDATGEAVTTSYGTGGDRNVGLRIVDDGGNDNETRRTVSVQNTAPRATFDASVERGSFAIEVDASAASDPDGEIEEYEWTVEDGRVDRGSGIKQTLEIDERGRYDVQLVVTDNGNRESQTTQTISVSRRPNPEISVRDTVGAGQTVELSAAGSTSPGGTVDSYQWTFPDGETANGETVTTSFETIGEATVQLTVADDVGTTQTVNRSLTVVEPPEVDIEVSSERPADNELVTFQVVGDEFDRVEWDFDRDGETDSLNQTARTRFADPGERTVQVRVTDPDGVQNTDTATLTVRDVDPNVTFDWAPKRPRNGLGVTFQGNSTDQIAAWDWDFDGDGEFEGTGQKSVYRFNDTGPQAVTLRVTDQFGDTATLTREVTVQQSANFELRVSESDIDSGGVAVVEFTASNQLPDEQVRAKLILDLPGSGVSITSVDGASVASASETSFFDIPPGGSRALTIRLQFADAGQYEIGGQAVYRIGEDNDTRRVSSNVDGISVGQTPTPTATATAGTTDGAETGGDDPAPVLAGLGLLLIGVLLLWRRSRSGVSDDGESDE